VNSDAVLFLSLSHGKPLTEASFPGVKATLTLGGRLFTYSDSSCSRNGGLDSMPCAMSVRSPRQVGMLLASKVLVQRYCAECSGCHVVGIFSFASGRDLLGQRQPGV
jgi:hypothetical protein